MLSGAINHLDLTVSDLSVSTEFYSKVLGRLGYQKTAEYEGGVPCWTISNSNCYLSIGLHEARVDTPHNRYAAGLHHLAFHVTSRDGVNRYYEFLCENGVTILDKPAEYDYTPGYYAVFFSDPDGIKLEVVYEPRLFST